MHSFHTQTNEAKNRSQAGLTPKSKSFHESKSFHHRHAIMVGTHNWGFRKYWTQVFDAVEVPYSASFVAHLDRVVQRRQRWKEYHGKTEVKRRRAHKQDATEKKLLYENRTTEYASGIGLDIGSTPAATRKTRGSKTKRTQCKCGATTHVTSNSHLCKFNKKNLLLAATKAAEGKGGEKEGTDSNIIAAEEI